MPRRSSTRFQLQPQQSSPPPPPQSINGDNPSTGDDPMLQLRTQWKWAAFSQFFFTFNHLFAMNDVSLNVCRISTCFSSNMHPDTRIGYRRRPCPWFVHCPAAYHAETPLYPLIRPESLVRSHLYPTSQYQSDLFTASTIGKQPYENSTVNATPQRTP